MRDVILHSKNQEVTISSNGKLASFNDLQPLDILATAVAKDILDEIIKKSKLLNFDASNFAVRVILRKNMKKEKSKIVETQLDFPANTSLEVKNKLQKVADKSHLKRLLSNEILFEAARLKE